MKKKKVFVFIITGLVMAVLCSKQYMDKGQRTDKIDRKRCSVSRDRCRSGNTIVC